ncbi:MAG: aldo/keto reductase [Acidobacteria bacterium]|nr:aldo/keto reductase [Acidobacteriota bacterium]
MRYRRFGRTGWMISEIGYEMWGMGWTGTDDGESRHSLQRAVDLGCNFFDTAWAYGDGHSEKTLGELIRANPGKRLYIATKIPPKNMKWPSRREYTLDDCYPPEHVEEYVRRSLKNLGIPTIDLIQFHTWEDQWEEDHRWIKTVEVLRDKGMFRAVGISLNRREPWNGVHAVRSGALDAVQVAYNIFDQGPEDELLPACKEMDVGIIARVPLDEGALTGTLTLESRWPGGGLRNSCINRSNLEATLERVDALKSLVPKDLTLPEIALRFILDNPLISTVVPGMRKLTHVETNLAVSEAAPLPQDLHEILKGHRWDRSPD